MKSREEIEQKKISQEIRKNGAALIVCRRCGMDFNLFRCYDPQPTFLCIGCIADLADEYDEREKHQERLKRAVAERLALFQADFIP